jgi:DNA-binding MarR family transcriptional regulator
MEAQNREALNTLRTKLSTLSEDEWRILEAVEQSYSIHVESMYEELWLGPAYISDVLHVLERDGLIKIDRGYNSISEDITKLLRECGNIKLRDVLNAK